MPEPVAHQHITFGPQNQSSSGSSAPEVLERESSTSLSLSISTKTVANCPAGFSGGVVGLGLGRCYLDDVYRLLVLRDLAEGGGDKHSIRFQ